MAFLTMQLVSCHFFVLLWLLSCLQQASLFQCKGQQNQDVDWYVLYKIPRMPESSNPLIRRGVAYLYMDSDNFQTGWTLSKDDISSNNSIPAHTLAPLYGKKDAKDSLWFLYNDQPPNQPSKMNSGHTKGAVMVKENKGFWLIHSVPNFPPEPEYGIQNKSSKTRRNTNGTKTQESKIHYLPVGEYNYPLSGRVNGQSFLCISLTQDNFDTIGKQLMYNQIIVYKKNIPQNIAEKFTVLADAANEVKINNAPYNSKVHFYSSSGMEFISFAKSDKWNKDLYDDFVAPQLNTNLYAETWLNGRGKLPSECSGSSVFNIQSIYLSKADTEFKSSHDHSKWAVSVDGTKTSSWICVGDINRADTQFGRGGGTVCFNLLEVWKNYKDCVKDVEPCPKRGIFDKVKSWYKSLFSTQ